MPVFFSDESDFSVTFWNLNYTEKNQGGEESRGEVTEKVAEKKLLTSTEKKIIEIIMADSNVTQKEIALKIGISEGVSEKL